MENSFGNGSNTTRIIFRTTDAPPEGVEGRRTSRKIMRKEEGHDGWRPGRNASTAREIRLAGDPPKEKKMKEKGEKYSI